MGQLSLLQSLFLRWLWPRALRYPILAARTAAALEWECAMGAAALEWKCAIGAEAVEWECAAGAATGWGWRFW